MFFFLNYNNTRKKEGKRDGTDSDGTDSESDSKENDSMDDDSDEEEIVEHLGM